MENSFILTLNLHPSNSARLQESIALFTTAMTLDSKDSDAYADFGLAFYKESFLDQAAKAFNMAISLNGNQSYVYDYLGDTLYEQSKLDDAMKCYSRAISLDAKNIEAYLSSARIFLYQYK